MKAANSGRRRRLAMLSATYSDKTKSKAWSVAPVMAESLTAWFNFHRP
jgi:hypothetical protein